jgi:hypothetical protein
MIVNRREWTAMKDRIDYLEGYTKACAERMGLLDRRLRRLMAYLDLQEIEPSTMIVKRIPITNHQDTTQEG